MKKFLIKILLLSLPILLVIVLYVFCIEPHRNGDIGKLGFLPFDDHYDTLMLADAPQTNLLVEINDITQAKGDSSILTTGDSFSQKKKNGYQNMLAELYPNYIVYDYRTKGTAEPYQDVVDLLKYSDTLPQVIIVESVERYLLFRLASLDFQKENDGLMPAVSTSSDDENANVKDVKNWNYKAETMVEMVRKPILSTQEFLKKRCNIENPVKHLKLSRKLFSCPNKEDDLYFYADDLLQPDAETIDRAVTNLKQLISLAESRKVKFVFLVAADKYDLYKSHAKKNPYTDKVSQLSYFSDYQNIKFIDSKELLTPHLDNGEQDIYLCNDTHWSIKGAKYVAEELKNRIDNQ